MLPHLETVSTLNTMEHQERLREAAKDRIATSAQTSGRAPLTIAVAMRRVAASWLGGLQLRVPGSRNAQSPFPMTTDQARPAGQGA